MGGMVLPLTTAALAMHFLPEPVPNHPEAGEHVSSDRIELASHNGRRHGLTVKVGELTADTFDYWKPEKAETPILARYRLPRCQEYPEDGEIIIKELPSTVTAPMVFEALRKQMKPPDDSREAAIREIELNKKVSTIRELVVRQGTFVGDDGKKEIRNARLVAAVVESREKKFLVRLVGPKELVLIVQPDLEIFLSHLRN
jgi:hypothetical protein